MESEHAAEGIIALFLRVPDKIHVFFDSLLHNGSSVPVGNLITEAAANPRLLAGLRQGKETPGNGTRACMVIQNRRGTVFDAINQADHSAVIHIFQRQCFIQTPPKAFQNLVEILRGGIFCENTSRKSAVIMHVCIDHSGENQSPFCINKTSARIFGAQLFRRAHFNDFFPFYCNTAIRKKRIFRISGNHQAIAYQQHWKTSFGALRLSNPATLPSNTHRPRQRSYISQDRCPPRC